MHAERGFKVHVQLLSCNLDILTAPPSFVGMHALNVRHDGLAAEDLLLKRYAFNVSAFMPAVTQGTAPRGLLCNANARHGTVCFSMLGCRCSTALPIFALLGACIKWPIFLRDIIQGLPPWLMKMRCASHIIFITCGHRLKHHQHHRLQGVKRWMLDQGCCPQWSWQQPC